MKQQFLLFFIFSVLLTALTGSDIYSQTAGMRRIEKHSQELNSDAQHSKSKKVKRAEAKAERQKEREKEAYERAKAKDMKHRMDLQTPETKKRMKENRKLADKNNDRYHEPFLKRLFGRKHK